MPRVESFSMRIGKTHESDSIVGFQIHEAYISDSGNFLKERVQEKRDIRFG